MNVSFTEPPDLYALYLPISGAMEFQRNNQMTTSSPGALLACDLARVDKLFLREERSHVGIAFNRLTLARHLSELIDAPVDPHFELFGQVDVAQDKGWLSTMCMQVWSSLEADPERGAIARSNEMILRAIMVRLLETVPHQYSHLLNRRSSCAVPRHVKLAIDFMVANVAAPLTIEEIASATAVSVRSLQTAFQRFKNMTPLVYLRQLRLDQARLELQTTTDEYASVRSIANRWGFSNVSRFSEVYVRTFGEAASETLARRK
jgi:AraC-like DNA-binding protein